MASFLWAALHYNKTKHLFKKMSRSGAMGVTADYNLKFLPYSILMLIVQKALPSCCLNFTISITQPFITVIILLKEPQIIQGTIINLLPNWLIFWLISVQKL